MSPQAFDDNVNLLLESNGVVVLRRIAVALGLVGIVMEVIFFAQQGTVRGGASACYALLGGLILIISHRVPPRQLLLVFLWGVVIIPLYGAYRFGGLHSMALIGLPVSAFIGGIVLGRAHAIRFGIAIVAGLAMLVPVTPAFLSEGLLPSPVIVGIAYFTAVVLSVFLGARSTRAFGEQYGRAIDLSRSLEAQLHRTQESEDRFAALFRSIPLPAVAGDINGVVSDVNDCWITTFGISREEAVGRPTRELGIWASREQQLEVEARLRELGVLNAFPAQAIVRGQVRHFELNVALIRRDSAVLYIAIMHDQTDRLAAEEVQRTVNVRLETMVGERTRELTEAMATIRDTQEELIHTGTLASLGSLVAGISHELNTPIGNALTAATTLEDRLNETAGVVADGAIKRSVLDSYFAEGRETVALVVRSVSRAAALIASFKQVAADQTSERRREFDLAQLIEDNVATLRPTLKATPWVIEVTIPAGIACDSFPGAVGQVLTNLVQNAAIHAFGDRSSGKISITAEHGDGQVSVLVRDDGKGMPPNILAHIFDPFFTTRMGKGGGGLGLSVCRRIVNTVLGGDLKAHSTEGAGSCLILQFPAVAPGRL